MTLALDRQIRTSKSNRSSKIKFMTDSSYLKIILCIYNEPKTVKQISQEIGLTLSLTYRKIRELNKRHLLILSGDINSLNKREFRYRSKMDIIAREFLIQSKSIRGE